MKLTPQQVEQFQQKGYLKIPHRLITDDHLALLREHYDALFATKRGTSGEGLRNLAVIGDSEQDETADRSEEMLQIMEMWHYDEVYRQLLYHEPLLDIAESLIGSNIQLFHDQALYKPARHGGGSAVASGQRILALYAGEPREHLDGTRRRRRREQVHECHPR